jgi:hypothetical protein
MVDSYNESVPEMAIDHGKGFFHQFLDVGTGSSQPW